MSEKTISQIIEEVKRRYVQQILQVSERIQARRTRWRRTVGQRYLQKLPINKTVRRKECVKLVL